MALTNPQDADGWRRLGIACSNLDQWSRARDAFEQSLAFEPDNAQSAIGLAMALVALQDVSTLRAVRDDLLARFSAVAYTHVVDGHFNKIIGQRDRAIASYRRALDLDPMMTDAMFNLAELAPPLPADPLFTRMERLRRVNISTRDRINVCFALARALDAAKLYDRAFDCYEEGNAAARSMMKERGMEYDPAAVDSSAERIISRYTHQALSVPLAPLPLDLRMVFIVGLPRSGTTLTEQILSCHPDVAVGGELTLLLEGMREFESRRDDMGFDGAVNLADAREKSLLLTARERYLDGLFERNLDKRVVTDKLPGNFSAVGFAALMFPDAVFVHCCREPVAVCWSLYTANFGVHEPYYNSFEALAHYHQVYGRLMEHWNSALSRPIVEVHYEELVTCPEAGIRNLLAGCGLTWDDACLHFYNSDRPVHTASQLQVRRPVYRSAISRWRTYQKHLESLRTLLSAADGGREGGPQ